MSKLRRLNSWMVLGLGVTTVTLAALALWVVAPGLVSAQGEGEEDAPGLACPPGALFENPPDWPEDL